MYAYYLTYLLIATLSVFKFFSDSGLIFEIVFTKIVVLLHEKKNIGDI